MSDGFALQVSLKTRGIQNKDWASMVNIRGGSVEELDHYLDELLEGDTFAKIDKLERTLAAVDVIQTAFQAEASARASTPAPQSVSGAPAASQQAPPASTDGNIARYNPSWGNGPGNPTFLLPPGQPSPKGEQPQVCEHGPYQYKEFTKKDGSKNLKGFFCATKGSNCPGKFLF